MVLVKRKNSIKMNRVHSKEPFCQRKEAPTAILYASARLVGEGDSSCDMRKRVLLIERFSNLLNEQDC